MKRRIIVPIALFLLLVASIAVAVMIVPPPDEDLSSHEMIVVAKWNPTSITSRILSEWNAELDGLEQKEYEGFTTVEVIRSIKGDLKPGKHTIRMPLSMVSFQTITKGKGPTLFWFGSTQHPGAVDDVTVPCLWFLNKTKSWTKEDKTVYPTLTTMFGVQPLSKEKHYKKLMKSKKPNK
jgi:hypothetical protein